MLFRIGMILILAGVLTGDSQNVFVPAVLMLAGMVLVTRQIVRGEAK